MFSAVVEDNPIGNKIQANVFLALLSGGRARAYAT
jgi:hypothetical protein